MIFSSHGNTDGIRSINVQGEHPYSATCYAQVWSSGTVGSPSDENYERMSNRGGEISSSDTEHGFSASGWEEYSNI